MKKNCNNCHFFAKSVQLKEGRTTNSVSDSARKIILKTKSKPDLESFSSYRCNMGVWDEGIRDNTNFYESVVKESRNNCFYYPAQKSMMFAAAEQLQKRDAENSALKRSNKYTRIGLWLAAGALLLNALVGAFRIWNCA